MIPFKVGCIEQEYAVRRPPVASSASNLLHVLLQRAGGVVVKDVANVWLIDTHAEGICRDHDQTSRALHELMLGRDPFGSTHPAVIAHDRDTPPPEGASEVINRSGSGAVDDSGAEQGPDASAGSADLLGTAHDFYRQAKVRAVGRSHEHQRIAQAESFGNILAHARCRGSCKGEYRWIAQTPAGGAELQVGRSEVMAPFRDAVGFVHAEERRSSALELRCGSP